jgi:hypothetical protein
LVGDFGTSVTSATGSGDAFEGVRCGSAVADVAEKSSFIANGAIASKFDTSSPDGFLTFKADLGVFDAGEGGGANDRLDSA